MTSKIEKLASQWLRVAREPALGVELFAFVSEPSVVLPKNVVATSEICDEIRDYHADHPRLQAILRIVEGCGVKQRHFTQRFSEAISGNGVAARSYNAFSDSRSMAAEAGRRALRVNDVDPADIDLIITSHSTSFTVPNLDVHLINDLALRPTVSRIPMTTVACAGGVQSLIRAAEHVEANPGSTVLVVVAEALSTIYHQDETSLESMIYRALFGDSAGACLVTDRPLTAGFAIREKLEFILPDSMDRYWGEIDAAGLHFNSTKSATAAVRDVMPSVLQWMEDWRPSFAVIHPGGPKIISDTAEALGLGDEKARHSYASLEENGNLGGNAALDILRRTHTDPPTTGSEGVLIAYGPGFAVSCVRGEWN